MYCHYSNILLTLELPANLNSYPFPFKCFVSHCFLRNHRETSEQVAKIGEVNSAKNVCKLKTQLVQSLVSCLKSR